ncbi:MAG: T9SS type A sorting domain-containing protein [Bacteroidetes bacterium]|jgi:hypothetical protein|nr:T9SS type A sorting domain-containing protein [Bacteroidota bacterium]
MNNQVRHVIIHHSAGVNNDLNHENTVRNIYLFHTIDNGWSDIGYNYLIAWDGTIYKGRDPDSLAQDNVKGAHFCSANTETMGVCLLGNFETAEPPDAAIGALNQLLAWKLGKEMLDPLASFNHPLNNSLGIIAGHRNGCATLCPGENLYEKLDHVKKMTDTMMDLCNGISTSVAEYSTKDNLLIYPNPVNNLLYIRSLKPNKISNIKIFDVRGQMILNKRTSDYTTEIDISGIVQGVYTIHITVNKITFTTNLVIL